MNNDELATRRAQAIAEDRCFSKGRLRDEFRMKPAPGAEPVKWYKNTYGGRFAVYRIADCVPMREKRPLTSKQQLAGQRLSVLSRLNSTSGRMARQAYDWLSLAPLFLDTETTGLDNTAEALEIGLTDAAGQVVFEAHGRHRGAGRRCAWYQRAGSLRRTIMDRCGAATASCNRGPTSNYL